MRGPAGRTPIRADMVGPRGAVIMLVCRAIDLRRGLVPALRFRRTLIALRALMRLAMRSRMLRRRVLRCRVWRARRAVLLGKRRGSHSRSEQDATQP